MLQFIDNTPTYDEDTGVSFFACGLAEEETGEQDYRVVYMNPFGVVIHSRRSKDGVTVRDVSDEVIERFQAAHGTPSALRWLSRRLEDALSASRKERLLLTEAAALFRYYEEYHRQKGTEESLQKAERNRLMAEKLESAVRLE